MGKRARNIKMNYTPTGKRVKPQKSNMLLIREFMKEAGLKGNPNKYALLSSRMPPTVLSRDQRYTIEGVDWSDLDLPKLVHKRELKRYMNKEQAKMFWCNGIVTQK